MKRDFHLVPLCIGAALLQAPGRALAAPSASAAPTRNATATTNIYQPLGLLNKDDLNFGMATVTTGGTVVLDPNTDTVSVTGGVVSVGGSPHSALFEGIAPTGNVVIVRLPRSATTLTRSGGTETMTVDTWTIDGTTRRTIPSRTAYTFKVGGTLHVNPNQAEGFYTGTFTVDVQYP